jgi:hypothetical protein
MPSHSITIPAAEKSGRQVSAQAQKKTENESPPRVEISHVRSIFLRNSGSIKI